jgi:hypothetical protein
MREANLPTYRTAARVLEGQTGSGLKLVGWTFARMALIAPPMMVVGVPTRQAFLGAGIASALISSLTLLRIFNAGEGGGTLMGARPRPQRRRR